jgi:23S rRNA pseudouridine1911/1915/1917 synthase
MNIPVLYEDASLLIVDKPSGLLTIPTPKKEKRTLGSILDSYLKEKGELSLAHPCHRLDRETSGVIIYAKGKSLQHKVMELFKARAVKKSYLAFVHGRLASEKGEIKNSIEGMPAVTGYKVIEQRSNFAIVEVNPLTGRTNQIRIHFKQIGHPLVGESKFVFRRDYQLRSKRLCLHARSVEFMHPLTGKKIHIDTGLPQDLKKFLDSHS